MVRSYPGSLASKVLLAGLVGLFCLPSASLAADLPRSTVRVILDHDGAFEDFYATVTLALASQLNPAPVKLIGVTTSPTGEAYCAGSNGYPDYKRAFLGNFSVQEGTIDGITQKVLSLTQYSGARIYSGCDEGTAVINVPNQADDFGKPVPGTAFTPLRFQLPYGGRATLEPCLFHKEFVFFERDIVCWTEINRAFRDETLRYVLPKAQDALNQFNLPELPLFDPTKKASVFLAESMCAAYKDNNPLTIVSVGPATNLARAYDRLEKQPQAYGCPAGLKLSDLKSVITTRFMGGAWDNKREDNFVRNGGSRAYRLNEPFPVWTEGNIYYQAGEHIFGMHHLPYPGTNFEAIQTGEHKKAFNSLNNAEFNFWLDAVAVEKVLNSGVPVFVVPLNATNTARLQGFADRIQNSPRQCATAPAQFIKNVQLANSPAPGVFVFDSLFFWDTLASTTVWNNFVKFEDFNDLEITTPVNGDPRTVTGQISASELFRRDIGSLFRLKRANNPVKVGLTTRPAPGDPDFKTTIQNLVFGLICKA